MKRPQSITLAAMGAVFIALTALAVMNRRPAAVPMAKAPADNPGQFVPTDVALVATTGRPQMVEFFHYG